MVDTMGDIKIPLSVFLLFGVFLWISGAPSLIQKITIGLVIAAIVVVLGFILFSFAACIFFPSWVDVKKKKEKTKPKPKT